jgi:hypothetical protein
MFCGAECNTAWTLYVQGMMMYWLILAKTLHDKAMCFHKKDLSVSFINYSNRYVFITICTYTCYYASFFETEAKSLAHSIK